MQSHKVHKERNDIKCCVSFWANAVCLQGEHIETYARKKLDEFLLCWPFFIHSLAFGETKKNENPARFPVGIKHALNFQIVFLQVTQCLNHFSSRIFFSLNIFHVACPPARAHIYTQHNICSYTFLGYYFTPFSPCSFLVCWAMAMWMCASVTKVVLKDIHIPRN